MSSTREASSSQYLHQVVQNSNRTTLPSLEALLNCSPVVVLALKRGAGWLVSSAVRAWRPRRVINERSSFAFFSFWESSDVNLFPQRGGNCAQVVRRGCQRADAGAPGFAGGAHLDGQRESEIHAVS